MNFRPGEHVVCVDAAQTALLVRGRQYVVARTFVFLEKKFVALVGLGTAVDDGFFAARFIPAAEYRRQFED